MEIERKYIIEELPDNLEAYPSKHIKQGYVSIAPVIRIRQLDKQFILTIKGKGLLAREEFELEIDKDQFDELSKKVDGLIIDKTRYYITLDDYIIELDIFHSDYKDLIIAEVEFPSLEEANSFVPPDWFGKDVTNDPRYQNSSLSKGQVF
jgi:CYTH domain-containing protein